MNSIEPISPDVTSAELSADRILELAGAELSRAVYRTANVLLASPSDAEELTLDVLVKLHEHLGKHPDHDFAAWLELLPRWLDKATVAKAKSRTKKRKRHAGKLEELALMYEQLGYPHDGHEDAGGGAGDPESEALLTREVLAHLPSKHRFVITLKWGLGHADEVVAELLGSDLAGVHKAIGGVEQKLRDYAKYDPTARRLLEGLLGKRERSPLDGYIEVFGRSDEATELRIKRRFDTYLREGADELELTGEYHPSSASGFYESVELDGPLAPLDPAAADEAVDAAPPLVAAEQPSRAPWIVAGLASLALVVLAVAQVRTSQQLAAFDEALRELVDAREATPPAAGPERIEPGSFVTLTHGSRAEASRDSQIELVRDDADGAEFRLLAGSIGLHIKPREGVEWIVHAGDYRIVSAGTRFRVTHTDALPQVDVFEGRVRVFGGELAAAGVEVSSADRTLAAALARPAPALASADVSPEPGAESSSDELFARAIAARSSKETEAEALLRQIIDRGDDDWTSERAFEELRTLVAPREREELRAAYFERFPEGAFAEAFTAIECQAQDDEAASACWERFAADYPDSLYGP